MAGFDGIPAFGGAGNVESKASTSTNSDITPITSTERVLAIPELLEAVLLQLPVDDIARCERVCTHWQDVSLNSPQLMQRCFFSSTSNFFIKSKPFQHHIGDLAGSLRTGHIAEFFVDDGIAFDDKYWAEDHTGLWHFDDVTRQWKRSTHQIQHIDANYIQWNPILEHFCQCDEFYGYEGYNYNVIDLWRLLELDKHCKSDHQMDKGRAWEEEGALGCWRNTFACEPPATSLVIFVKDYEKWTDKEPWRSLPGGPTSWLIVANCDGVKLGDIVQTIRPETWGDRRDLRLVYFELMIGGQHVCYEEDEGWWKDAHFRQSYYSNKWIPFEGHIGAT